MEKFLKRIVIIIASSFLVSLMTSLVYAAWVYQKDVSLSMSLDRDFAVMANQIVNGNSSPSVIQDDDAEDVYETTSQLTEELTSLPEETDQDLAENQTENIITLTTQFIDFPQSTAALSTSNYSLPEDAYPQ